MTRTTIIVDDCQPGGPTTAQLLERIIMAESNIETLQREVAETGAIAAQAVAALTAQAAAVKALQTQVADMVANGATGEQLQGLATALDEAQAAIQAALPAPAPAPEPTPEPAPEDPQA